MKKRKSYETVFISVCAIEDEIVRTSPMNASEGDFYTGLKDAVWEED